MSRTIPILLILWLAATCSAATPNPETDYRALLKRLEASLLEGNKRALRDLGTLLDHPELSRKAQRIIRSHTLFTAEEFTFSDSEPRIAFLNFYYDVERRLKYSDLLEVFYLTEPELWQTSYKIGAPEETQESDASVLLNQYIQQVSLGMKMGNDSIVLKGFEQLQELDRPEGYAYLTDLLKTQKFKKAKFAEKKVIYERLALILQEFVDIKVLKALLDLINKNIYDLDFSQARLANLTNVHLEAKDTKTLVKKYNHLIDSLTTIEEIRAHGYRIISPTRPVFFVETVDYYGRMLTIAGKKSWIEYNAIRDLSQQHHPRAMYYLAGHLFRIRKKSGKYNRQLATHIVSRISRLTHLVIQVTNKKDEFSDNAYSKRDHTARKNYMLYWAAHYDDYEWDENRSYFVNKNEAIETTQNYERLFRRLNSRNDSVAIASFVKLTEGEPNEVIALSEKYRQMFRNYNQSLPSFQYKYLEQLSQLTYYCRKNNIDYQLSPAIEKLLTQLLQTESPSHRVAIENTLIQQLTLDEITGLEYWACLHEGKLETSYSIGRILDWFYSRSLEDIQNDNHQLRLYLKKADIFGNIGAVGACNYYLNKLSLEDKNFQDKLLEIHKTEADEGILNQLVQMINNNSEDSGTLSLTEFLEDPTAFHKRDIKVMGPPAEEQYTQIVQAIRDTEDIKAIRKILYYIRTYAEVAMVPELFTLLDDDRILIEKRDIVLTVADNLVPVMESIYNYSFTPVAGRKKFDIIPWKNMWETKRADYREWAKFFFEQKLASILKTDTLTIEDINQITTSVHYGPLYQDRCLKALKKVRPVRDIRKLEVDPLLLVSTDLMYFDSFEFSYKELDDIPKLFTVDQPRQMLDFLFDKSADFKISDKGPFYNNLFRSGWFLSYVGSGTFPAERAKEIQTILAIYFNENEYLSEFEEQVTQFNIAQLSSLGKTLEEQLMASFEMNADRASLIKIQESILARVTYRDLPLVIKCLPRISPELLTPDRFFLVSDFGLPVFELDEERKRNEFIKHHQEMSELEFYHHYLTAFGVDFQNADKSLNFQKIYHILSYDVATPFVSSSGGKRDYYTYGIIKLLELHFKDRLGFHEKLNEAQTFYDFSSSKRAAAWIEYLETHQLINPTHLLAPSFNLTRLN